MTEGYKKNKIDRYGLGPRVVELYREGKTTIEIAEYITEGIKASGIDDSVDQSSVSRWLKKVKELDEEQREAAERVATEVVRRRVEDSVEGDVNQIEWVQDFFFKICQNTLPDKTFTVKERVNAGVNLVKLIDTKLRLPGVMPEDDGADDTTTPALPARSNVHSILGRLNRAVET